MFYVHTFHVDFHIWFIFLKGKVGSYMSDFVCLGKNEALLMPDTAKSYYSAVKCYLVWKFKDNEKEIPNFRDHIWKKYLDTMWKRKLCLHHEAGLPVRKSKSMIPDNHRQGISKLCIWNADPTSASFMALNSSLYHHAARTIETSSLRKTQMRVNDENNGLKNMKVLSNIITRSKIGQPAEVICTYPHESDILLCYHFAIAYSLILNR